MIAVKGGAFAVEASDGKFVYVDRQITRQEADEVAAALRLHEDVAPKCVVAVEVNGDESRVERAVGVDDEGNIVVDWTPVRRRATP